MPPVATVGTILLALFNLIFSIGRKYLINVIAHPIVHSGLLFEYGIFMIVAEHVVGGLFALFVGIIKNPFQNLKLFLGVKRNVPRLTALSFIIEPAKAPALSLVLLK